MHLVSLVPSGYSVLLVAAFRLVVMRPFFFARSFLCSCRLCLCLGFLGLGLQVAFAPSKLLEIIRIGSFGVTCSLADCALSVVTYDLYYIAFVFHCAVAETAWVLLHSIHISCLVNLFSCPAQL